MPKPYIFQCAICEKWIKVKHPRTSEELNKEMIETFGDLAKESKDNVEVCDDCWKKLQYQQPFDEKFVERCNKVGNHED